jgi:hypothetical protein
MTEERRTELVTDESLERIELAILSDTEPDMSDLVEWLTATIQEIRRLRNEWHDALDASVASLINDAERVRFLQLRSPS